MGGTDLVVSCDLSLLRFSFFFSAPGYQYKTMVKGEFEHGFKVKWMRKDLAIVLEGGLSLDWASGVDALLCCARAHALIPFLFAEAKARGVSMPVTALVDQYYAAVMSSFPNGENFDTSSLIALLEAKKTLTKRA